MSSTLDGLSNLTAVSARIEALKNAKLNSAAALNATASTATGTNVDSLLIQNEQNFSKMLDILTASSDDQSGSANSTSFLGEQDSTLNSLAEQQTTLNLKRLAAMEETSPLIGRTVSYYTTDSAAQKSGVVSSVAFTDGSSGAILVLADGARVPTGAVTELK